MLGAAVDVGQQESEDHAVKRPHESGETVAHSDQHRADIQEVGETVMQSVRAAA